MNDSIARELAKNLIRHAVKRGDSLNTLVEGQMSWMCQAYAAQIGGTVWVEENGQGGQRDINRYRLVVTSLAGQECFIQFSVEQLMKEIQDEDKIQQKSLWS